jgi:Mn-dependent DtxR family transcriptional regulator
MGSEEVIELLKREKEPIGRAEIARKLKRNPENISHLLKKLIKLGDIGFIVIERMESRKYTPKCNRKLKLYYIK